MKKGMRLFGLVLVAGLSVMALTAVGAQAAILEDQIYVNGALLGTDGDLNAATITGEGGAGKLVVPALKLTIECKKSLITAQVGNLKKMAHADVHVLYHECVPLGSEKFCKIYPTAADRTAKTNAGLILATALILAALHPVGTLYLIASQLEKASSFTTIFMSKATEGCTLPPENTVTGSTAFRVPNNAEESVSHEIVDITDAEETLLKELGLISGLAYGGNPATIEGGNGSGSLTDEAHLGNKFSIHL